MANKLGSPHSRIKRRFGLAGTRAIQKTGIDLPYARHPVSGIIVCRRSYRRTRHLFYACRVREPAARHDRPRNRIAIVRDAPSSAPGRFKCRRRNFDDGRRFRCCSSRPAPQARLAMLGLARCSGGKSANAGSVQNSPLYHENSILGSEPAMPRFFRSVSGRPSAEKIVVVTREPSAPHPSNSGQAAMPQARPSPDTRVSRQCRETRRLAVRPYRVTRRQYLDRTASIKPADFLRCISSSRERFDVRPN